MKRLNTKIIRLYPGGRKPTQDEVLEDSIRSLPNDLLRSVIRIARDELNLRSERKA